jgi:MoxR-like ATPase
LDLSELLNRISTEVGRIVVGQEDLVEAMLVGLAVRGHVLL